MNREQRRNNSTRKTIHSLQSFKTAKILLSQKKCPHPHDLGQYCIPKTNHMKRPTADLHINVRILTSVTRITLTLLR